MRRVADITNQAYIRFSNSVCPAESRTNGKLQYFVNERSIATLVTSRCSSSDTGTIAVVAEKPSVARDIAKVLGATTRGEGYLHGNGYVVTWVIGHLASLAQPHEMDMQWKPWRRETLPMLPDAWPLVVYEKTKDQFEVVRKILSSSRVGNVICATDAGREGELIFRYIYEATGCSKPISRLWISSLTPEAIRKGFDAVKPGKDYEPLANAARGRSRADWLVGMNAFTCVHVNLRR